MPSGTTKRATRSQRLVTSAKDARAATLRIFRRTNGSRITPIHRIKFENFHQIQQDLDKSGNSHEKLAPARSVAIGRSHTPGRLASETQPVRAPLSRHVTEKIPFQWPQERHSNPSP